MTFPFKTSDRLIGADSKTRHFVSNTITILISLSKHFIVKNVIVVYLIPIVAGSIADIHALAILGGFAARDLRIFAAPVFGDMRSAMFEPGSAGYC